MKSQARTEPTWARWLLLTLALAFLGVFVALPLVLVFEQALEKGWQAYVGAMRDPQTRSAVALTMLTCAFAVPLNAAFGVAAAWAVTRFEFRGKTLIVTLMDLPLAISPVVAGMLVITLFGGHGLLGPALEAHGIRIVFAAPGVVLATVFVTLPFVARELIPTLQATGVEQEEAARLLGASGWQIFRRVTLPSIKWALLYGLILSNARAMGEFGAVSVVSGHIRGKTATVPLQVEMLYDEYDFQAAFAVASVLATLAILTLLLKMSVEWFAQKSAAEPAQTERGA